MLVSMCLELTGPLLRAELQWINHRYEVRPWILWTKESLARLNPAALWNYHETHEFPRQWWAWDYTLTWLIENNHPPVKQKIVIFNHLLEDEPPLEAVRDHPWMAPLTRQPMSRGAVAEMVRFLARAGAKQIILDNDFPGFTAEDEKLARIIYMCSSGELTGKKIPVLMARTINHRSSGTLLQLHQQPAMSGVLRELQKFDPKADVIHKYTGTTAAIVDEDLVVRRMASTIPSPSSEDTESLTLKSLKLQGIKVSGVPSVFDIDFASPPNSHLYPVRPISYLFDPESRAKLLKPATESGAVDLKGAVVIVGDGVTDLMSTPHTNYGMNLMSGSEVLAHGMDTVVRKSWHTRFYKLDAVPFLFFITLLGTTVHFTMCALLRKMASPAVLTSLIGRFLPDAGAFAVTVITIYLISCIAFAYGMAIMPMVPVLVGLTFATLSATLYEREEERTAHINQQLSAARDKFESALKLHESEARNREAERDNERKKEFARRINHDLKAPVSVLNWTLARLRQDGIAAKGAPDKIERLERTTDRLFRLIGELVHTYDEVHKTPAHTGEICDLRELIFGSIDVQSTLAETQRSRITIDVPDEPMHACGSGADFARIINNLMRNALIHNAPGTTVNVSARTHGDEHILSVSDNGKGIPMDRLPSLFESPVRGKTENNTGSGLAIVKQLVEAAHAEIFVDSKVGSGTTFLLHIKQAPAAKPEAAPEPYQQPEQVTVPVVPVPVVVPVLPMVSTPAPELVTESPAAAPQVQPVQYMPVAPPLPQVAPAIERPAAPVARTAPPAPAAPVAPPAAPQPLLETPAFAMPQAAIVDPQSAVSEVDSAQLDAIAASQFDLALLDAIAAPQIDSAQLDAIGVPAKSSLASRLGAPHAQSEGSKFYNPPPKSLIAKKAVAEQPAARVGEPAAAPEVPPPQAVPPSPALAPTASAAQPSTGESPKPALVEALSPAVQAMVASLPQYVQAMVEAPTIELALPSMETLAEIAKAGDAEAVLVVEERVMTPSADAQTTEEAAIEEEELLLEEESPAEEEQLLEEEASDETEEEGSADGDDQTVVSNIAEASSLKGSLLKKRKASLA